MSLIQRSAVPTLVVLLMIFLGVLCPRPCYCADVTTTETTGLSSTPKPGEQTLQGSVTVTQTVNPLALSRSIEDLTNQAIERNAGIQELDKAVNKHQSLRALAVHKVKDSLNFAFFYRGDGPSAEAGDIILDEKVKIKDHSSAAFMRQKLADQLHLAVVSNVMQLAEGVGNPDRESGKKQIDLAHANLKTLVGPEAAQRMLDNMKCLISVNVPESIYKQKPWGIVQHQVKLKRALDAALENDAVVADIKNAIHKYNRRSRAFYVTTRAVKTTLGIGALTPSIVGTACSLSEYAFIMATGGPEEDKIIKELYLDKRLQSHGAVLTEKAHMAIFSYQMARMTRNPALLICSQSVLRHMTNKDAVAEILETGDTAIADAKDPLAPDTASRTQDTVSAWDKDGQKLLRNNDSAKTIGASNEAISE